MSGAVKAVTGTGFPRVHGKKRALLIGIKYKTCQSLDTLSGTINDINLMKSLLCQKYGFPSDCILVLSDEESNPRRKPMKSNIMLAMQWLVHGCSSGDSLVFHFAGHGVQKLDNNGDELDGYDEALCPLDRDDNGDIRDDDINKTIVRPLVHGVKLHAIIDACHSGTVLDLRHLWQSRNGKPADWVDQRTKPGAWKNVNTSGGHAILISGCTDSGYSDEKDYSIADMGTLTHGFLKAARSDNGTLTYGSLFTKIKAGIRRDVTLPAPRGGHVRKVGSSVRVQVPQLSSSVRFDINRTKFML